MKLAIQSLAVGAAGVLTAQDLLPRAVEGSGGVEVRLGKATKVRGWAPDESEVLLERLNKLRVVGIEDRSAVVNEGGIELQGLSVGRLDELAAELGEWIGKPLTVEGLDRLGEVILRHYDEEDRPMNDVYIPPQDGTGGRIVVEVTEGRLGRIGVGQTRHFDPERLRAMLRSREGERLRGSVLQADVDWLSRNPFRRAALFVSPGEGVSADVLFAIDEQRPWRVYSGYDNTGSEAVGENRWFVGANWGDGFGCDQVLGYQFTQGDSIDDFQAHALSWEFPFPQHRQFMRVSGAWAEVAAEDLVNGTPTQSEGTSWQLEGYYGAQLPRWRGWRQEARVGLQFKRSDNFALFGETSVPGATVDVIQIRGEWEGHRPFLGGDAEVLASLVLSPGELSAYNGSDEFSAFRTGADPSYVYGRLEAEWTRRFADDWNVTTRGSAQWGSGALLPTEQLALGGYSTVRGHEERVLLADSGYVVSAELYTPALRRSVGHRECSLRGLVFVDHAWGWREGEGGESLTGVGVGARLQVAPGVSGRVDLGWDVEGGDGPRVHAGVVVSF